MAIEAAAEQCALAGSLEAAAGACRPEIELPGVLRWLRRRRRAVATLLVLVRGLLPLRWLQVALTLPAWRQVLGVEWVLPALRAVAAEHLQRLPPPLGFRPPLKPSGEPWVGHQHRAGPDPPAQRA